MFRKTKGQSATEYLMTYGWALLAIVIVAGVLWNMGIFGGACAKASKGFVGTTVSLADWAVNADGSVDVELRNAAGAEITVIGLGGNTTIAAGGSGVVTNVTQIAAGNAGDCYSDVTLTIDYQVTGGLSHSESGKISGSYE